MNNLLKFSVLMSVYYKENPEYFDSSLKSILIEQSLIPNEFVLICDGELGNGLNAIINKYENQFPSILKVFRLQKNGGLGNALNFGLTKCSNELIARADSDDICAKNRFEKQIEFMINHSEIDILGSDIQEFNENPENSFSYKRMLAKNEEIYKMAKFRNPVNHMTVLFKKKIVEKAGSYQHLPYLEDYYLWVRIMALHYKFANINEPLVFARIGNGMINRRGNKLYISGWKVLNKFMLNHKMINLIIYIRNMIAVRFFIFMPKRMKSFIYKILLRRN